ncbi:hypothetical protein GLOIN_2v1778046 [Rhizophagus irregularis DAOM 181602=DAOM 197198]|nr:hypothetical protein GLOIN_2v1778046 [Rhizophagus irregularis DAOM 181602=DAOM 197198]
MTIDELYRKILRIGRQANYRPEELRRKFLDALPLLWLEKAEDIGEHLPLDELAKKLYEIELCRIARHKRDRTSDLLVSNRASRQIYEPSPVLALQQQEISLEDMQEAIQNALAQQKTENQTLVKKVTELQSQITQQAQVPAPQTVKPIRQPRGPPSSLKTEEGLKNYYVSEYLKEIGLLSKEDLDSDYPVKPFQRPPDLFQKKAFIQKCGICGETGHSKGSCPKRPIAQSKFTWSYFTPLTPIVPPDSDDEENGGGNYDEDDNRWIGYDLPVKKNSQPETYDQLLSKLSPPIRKMCLSRKAQEEKLKESDEWLSSLQYLNAIINDLTISESFLDSASEFGGINDPAIKAFGWKADKPSNFAIKGNSKHITDSLGWYTDVPVTLKDKENKTVTVIGNFVHIDNGETELMLFFGMSNIRKVQGVLESNKNQFRIKLHGKVYIIPTFSKAPVVKDLPKEEQDQVSTDSSSPTREDLKKSV